MLVCLRFAKCCVKKKNKEGSSIKSHIDSADAKDTNNRQRKESYYFILINRNIVACVQYFVDLSKGVMCFGGFLCLSPDLWWQRGLAKTYTA